MLYEDRWYQEEAVQSFFDYFERGKRGNPLIAMPTGTGKSLVLAKIIARILQGWPSQRIMVMTHVKELIEQNAGKMTDVMRNAPIGVYSAGLKSRDMAAPILYGGVQSVSPAIKRANAKVEKPVGNPHFGWRDLVFIDEAHLLSDNNESMYQYVLSELLRINPNLKVCGLTATPYRLKMGHMKHGSIFTDVCYDLTTIDAFNRLIYEGYLSPPLARPTENKIDLSGIGLVAGEFNQKQLANIDDDETLFKAVKEMVYFGQDRNCWLSFAVGINNAEKIKEMQQYLGVQCEAVHSGNSTKENDAVLKALKSGQLKSIVNANKLTTGFDYPPIDLIGMFRATMSPGLWVQMIGRGTRPSPETGKRNCLVLDFAGNTPRLGPINDPAIPLRPNQRKGPSEMPAKLCPACSFYNHTTAKVCVYCGEEFKFESKVFEHAGTEALLRDDNVEIQTFEVHQVIYNRHEKRDSDGNLTSPPMIKVSYFAGLKRFDEYLMLEHSGFGAKRSRDWWRQRHPEEPPATTSQALELVSQLRQPKKIRVHVNKKYPEILSCEW